MWVWIVPAPALQLQPSSSPAPALLPCHDTSKRRRIQYFESVWLNDTEAILIHSQQPATKLSDTSRKPRNPGTRHLLSLCIDSVYCSGRRSKQRFVPCVGGVSIEFVIIPPRNNSTDFPSHNLSVFLYLKVPWHKPTFTNPFQLIQNHSFKILYSEYFI